MINASKKQFLFSQWQPLAIFCLFLIVFVPVLGNDFIFFDDDVLIFQNPLVLNGNWSTLHQVWAAQWGTADWKPLTYLTWILEQRCFGGGAYVHHLINLLLHAFNGVLVFFLLRKLFALIASRTIEEAGLWAFLGTLVWGLHPLRVESVAWAVERKDVLFGFFYLAGLLCLLRAPQNRFWPAWALGALTCFMLSILSKSMGITWLLTAPLLLAFHPNISSRARQLAVGLPVLMAILGMVAVFFLFKNAESHVNSMVKNVAGVLEPDLQPSNVSGTSSWYKALLLNAFRIQFYLYHQLFPMGLSVIYPKKQVVESVGPLIHFLPWVLVGLLGALAWFRKQVPLVFVGFMFFLLAILPALVMPSDGTNFASDRYSYIPSVGLSLCWMGIFLFLNKISFFKNAYAKGTLIGLILAVFAFQTYQRCTVWNNTETIFTDTISKYPTTAIPYVNRGIYFYNQKRVPEALGDFNSALAISPDFGKALYNRGLIRFRQGDQVGAMADFSHFIEIEPFASQAYAARCAVHGKSGNFELAHNDCDKAMELEFYAPDAFRNKAKILILQDRFAEAIPFYDKYLNFFPNDPEAYYFRGMLHDRVGNFPAGIADLSKAIELSPSNGEYYLRRSECYAHSGNAAQAQSDLQAARRLGVNK